MSRINDKILLVAIGIWIGTSTAFGQEETSKKNEVSLNFGLGPYEWEREWASSNPNSRWSNFVLTVQGMHQVTNWLDVGCIAGWYPSSDATQISMMLAFRGNWIHKRLFKLYSEFDFGGQYSTDYKWEVGMQWTILGTNFELGKNFFGQAEFGLGSKGLLIVGLGYKF